MKKSVLIVGLVLAVVGIVLMAFTGLPQFGYEAEFSKNWDVAVNEYVYYNLDADVGTQFEFSFSSDIDVNFGVMDSGNFERYEAGEGSFDVIYGLIDVTSAKYTFEATKTDTFYFVVENPGISPARVSVTYGLLYTSSPMSYVAVAIIAVGAIITIIGFRLKPKIQVNPPLESK